MNIVFLCAAVGVLSDNIRRDAVKNTLDALIVAVQTHFLQLLDGTFLFAFFQSFRQLGIFLLQRFLLEFLVLFLQLFKTLLPYLCTFLSLLVLLLVFDLLGLFRKAADRIILLQLGFLQFFKRTLLLALFQSSGQIIIFLFECLFLDSAVVKHF